VSSTDSPAGLVVSLIGGSHFVNHTYFMLLPPIFGALQAELGISTARSGLALGLVGLVVVALQLPFGYLSDTYSRTLVLAISLVVGAIGAALTATVQSYSWLLVAAVVTGVGIAGHHPAHYPMLSAATDPGQRGRAYSIHGFTGALGFAAPPAVVGAVASPWVPGDWRLAIGLLAAVGAVYAVGCLWIVVRHVPRSVTHAPGSQDRGDREPFRTLPRRIFTGLRSTFSATAIVLLTLLWFLVSMTVWGIQAYTAPLLIDGYGASASAANLLVSVMLTFGAIAILGGGWLTDHYGPRATVLGAIAGMVVVAATLASGSLPVAVALAVTLVFAATIKAARPALSTLGDALSTRDDLGKNFGLLTIGISGGGAVAPPVFGALSDATSIQTVFWAVAGIGVVAFLFTFVVLAVGERSGDTGLAID
jgi:MFS family permease